MGFCIGVMNLYDNTEYRDLIIYSIIIIFIFFFSWDGGTFFLSFFLGFRRPNLITGLSGWRTPD